MRFFTLLLRTETRVDVYNEGEPMERVVRAHGRYRKETKRLHGRTSSGTGWPCCGQTEKETLAGQRTRDGDRQVPVAPQARY